MTREQMQVRLMEATEELLGAEGVADLSVRAVTTRAGVNVASVSTAFGGRTALLEAVFTRRLETLSTERLRRLSETRDEGGALVETVQAFTEPLLHEVRRADALVLSQLLTLMTSSDESGADAVERLLIDPVVAVFEADLRRLLPEVPVAVLSQRLTLTVAVVHAAAASPGPALARARNELVAFLVSGLSAPAGVR